MEMIWRIDYAHDLLFQLQAYLDGTRRTVSASMAFEFLHPDSSFYPFYTDVVFVHNEEEAQDLPENVIAVWPSTEPIVNQAIINRMHHEVNRAESDTFGLPRDRQRPIITLEEFGLTYPITVADLVDNWEKVAALRVALGLFHAPP